MQIDATIGALADSTRRELLRRLADKPCRAGELARGFAISRPAICKHTRMLGRAGLIRVKKVGRERIYELAPRGQIAIQELISNILKYAQATEISLNLNRDLNTNILVIIVEDDGIGFDKTEKINGKGMGLKNIASRAERLNGTFNIDSNIGKGTTAIIEVPV